MASNVTNINEPNRLQSDDNVETLNVEHRAAETAAPVEPAAEVKDGQVKWFDAVKGYGFLVPSDNSDDVLIHKSILRDAGIDTIYEGTVIVCEVVCRERGQQATRIISTDDSNALVPPPKDVRPKVPPIVRNQIEAPSRKLRGRYYLWIDFIQKVVSVHVSDVR